MKVLWFVNMMLPRFAEALGLGKSNIGGWMPAMIEALGQLAPDIQLTVACASKSPCKRVIGNVLYIGLGEDVGVAARQLCEREKPSVVHVHGTETIAIRLPKEIIGSSNTLVTLQGIISGCGPHYNGEISSFELRRDRNLVKELMRNTGLFQLQKQWLKSRSCQENEVFRCARNIGGRTDWDRAWARYLNSSARYFEIGELMRSPFYCGPRLVSDIVPHTIYCSAALSYPLKGGHWLLRAVAKLRETYPDVQLRIADACHVNRPTSFIGRLRWGEYERYCYRLIRTLGIVHNVKLLGPLDAKTVAAELCHAEVFCLPSHCENSPNSMVEAMLLGVPVVSTYVGGVPTVVMAARQGQMVPSGDPAVLVDAIERVFCNFKDVQRAARQASELAKVLYDPKRVVGQLISAYHEIMR